MDGQNYLVFHTAADDSYMNSSANFKGADVTSNTEITVYFASANGAEAQDSVVLNITAGTEVAVMEALGAALAGAKNPVTVVADDINSKYVHDSITSCGAISVNRGIYRTVMSVTGNTTLTTADSGKIVTINPGATSLIQLPAAAGNAGWNVRITCTEGDGGTMDQIVNIGTLAGEFFDGFIVTADTELAVFKGIAERIEGARRNPSTGHVTICDDVNSVFAHKNILSCTLAIDS